MPRCFHGNRHVLSDFHDAFREIGSSFTKTVTVLGKFVTPGVNVRLTAEKGFSAWLRTLVFKGVIREAGARMDVSWDGRRAGPCGHCRAFLTGAARRLRCSEARLRDL